MANDLEKFQELKQRAKELDTKKIRLEEQYKAKKKALSEIVKKIGDAGYKPNELKNVIKEKESEFSKLVSELEENLDKAAQTLEEIEG
jgi:chromosome segregation ATPase